MTPVRVGLVGSGPWAEMAVAPALAAADGVELAAGWSRNEAALAALARQHRFETVPDVAELFAQVDAVAFCVPPDVQARLLPVAVEAGRALLLEKPVARNVEQAAVLLDHRAPVLVHYARLLDAHVQPWLDAAAGNVWARARVVLTNSATLGDDPFGRSPWRREDDGALWDLGPHALAALQLVLGTVTAVAARRQGADIVLDTEHERGATAEVVVSLAAAVPEESVALVDLAGREHRLEVAARQSGATTYAAMVGMLLDVQSEVDGPDLPLTGCAAAVANPQFSIDLVAALVAASRSLRAV